MMPRSVLRTLGMLAAAFLSVSCSDSAADLSAPGLPTTVTIQPQYAVAGTPVVISQVYGAGGNSGALWQNDFVELFNPGTAAVDIGEWSVQYASSSGTSWGVTGLPAGSSIQAGGYFLIRLAGGSTGEALPAPDATGSTNMSGSSGKVILSRTSAQLSSSCPATADVVDQVGFGTANCSTWGEIGTLSSTKAALRNDGGCMVTGSNTIDFSVGTPVPRNSATATSVCDVVVVTEPAVVSVTPPDATIELGQTQAFAASAVDAGGQPVGTTYTWSSSDETVATIVTPGVFRGAGLGSAIITAMSANGVTSTATLNVLPPPAIPDVAISQIYGGGGNSGAPYKNDYVELFNRGSATVEIGGWSVQYGSSSGTTWQVTAVAAGVELEPGQYYLIQLGAGSGDFALLPTPDATGSTNMSGTVGKVVLSRTSAALAGACPVDANVVDRVNFGTSANCETVWTDAPAPSNSNAILRNDDGCAHTGEAEADFTAGAPQPRNTSSPRNPCQSEAGEPATVSVSPSAATVQTGNTLALLASALDENSQPATTTYTWASSNTAIADVDANGVVTGAAAGVATITATSANDIAGSATITVTIAPVPSSGIVITEVMAHPAVTDDFGEWFEVLNNRATAVDLQGWEIRSARSTGPDESHIIGASVVIPAGGLVVIGNNTSSDTNGGAAVAYAYVPGTITLSNGSNTEWLLLKDAAGVTADSVAYSPRNADGTVINPTFLPTDGVAREVVDAAVDNSALSSSNWRDAAVPFGTGAASGTPGYGAYGVAGPVVRIAVSPSPASVLVGGTRAMTAVAIDALGRIASEALSWSSSNTGIATVNASGEVAGHAPGSVTITTTAGSGVHTETTLAVVDPSAPATISISDPGWLPAGYQQSLFISVRSYNGQTLSDVPLTFTSSDPSVLRVDIVEGRTYLTGVGAGTAEIRATAENGVFGVRMQSILPGTAATSAVYRDHSAFGVPTDADASDDIMVSNPQYVASYNALRGGPNWVSWNLNATHFGTTNFGRCDCFSPDATLPAGVYLVNDVDYIGTGGYDRGHMVQSDSRSTTMQENAATFLMTNILPQAAESNQGPWAKFETFLNGLAENQGKDIYIVAGGEYAASPPSLPGESRVAIPDYTWKVAIVLPYGQSLGDVVSPQSIEVYAIRMPNLAGVAVRNAEWQEYETTVDAVEAAVGYDVFALLPDHIERIVEANDHPPVADIGGVYTGDEGVAVSFNGSAADVDAGDVLTYTWSFGDGSVATGNAPTHTYADNGVFDVTLIVTDMYGAADTVSTTATIDNAAPMITALDVTASGIAVSTPAQLTASFTDAGSGDTHTATIDWGDGTTSAVAATGGLVATSHSYAAQGFYTVTLTLSDDDGAEAIRTAATRVVVFNSASGSVNAAGWVDSPAGRTTLSLNARYLQDGRLSGNLVAKVNGGLQFSADTFEWLVITNDTATVSGSGTIKGQAGAYRYVMTAVDSGARVRLIITDAAGAVVFDNVAAGSTETTTPLGAGNVTVRP